MHIWHVNVEADANPGFTPTAYHMCSNKHTTPGCNCKIFVPFSNTSDVEKVMFTVVFNSVTANIESRMGEGRCLVVPHDIIETLGSNDIILIWIIMAHFPDCG